MDTRDEHLLRVRDAMRRFTTGFAVSHLSAAVAHGLPTPLGAIGPVHLTAIHAVQHSRRASGVVHHSDSTVADLTEAGGLVVTGVARTVADCLRTLAPRVSVPIADAAERDLGLDVDEIAHQLDTQRRWRGRPRARQWLRIVDGRRESWLESLAAVCFAEAHVEIPVPQVTVLDAWGRFVARVDGGWVEDSTVFEVDGRAKYSIGGADPARSFFAEKRRHNDLVNVGLSVVRCELGDLLYRLGDLTRTVEDARRRGRASRFTGSFVVPPRHHRPGTGDATCPTEDTTRRGFAS